MTTSGSARSALERLHPAVPGRTLDVNQSVREVEIVLLQRHDFADSQTAHGRGREHRAPRLRSDENNSSTSSAE